MRLPRRTPATLLGMSATTLMMTPKDSHELHDLPLQVSVKLKKRSDTGELANEIAAYEKKDAASGQPQQATSDVPPWKR